MKFTFNPRRYHTTLDEVREILHDTTHTIATEDLHKNIVLNMHTPTELAILFSHLGAIKQKEPDTAYAITGLKKINNTNIKNEAVVIILAIILAGVLIFFRVF